MLQPDEGPRGKVPRAIEDPDLKKRTWITLFPSRLQFPLGRETHWPGLSVWERGDEGGGRKEKMHEEKVPRIRSLYITRAVHTHCRHANRDWRLSMLGDTAQLHVEYIRQQRAKHPECRIWGTPRGQMDDSVPNAQLFQFCTASPH